MNDVLLLASLGGAWELRNVGLGFPEDVSELTFRLPGSICVIVHAVQFLQTNLVPVRVYLVGILN